MSTPSTDQADATTPNETGPDQAGSDQAGSDQGGPGPIGPESTALAEPHSAGSEPGAGPTGSGRGSASAEADAADPSSDPAEEPSGQSGPEEPTSDAEQDQFRLVIVTGMSGAGRSTTANALEDVGWYVVDNLPPSVLLEVCELALQANQTRLAVVLDVRTRSFFEQLPTMFSDLSNAGIQAEIVYLEADDDVIVRRQESARRPHPLQGDGRLMDGITAERASLATLRAAADLVVDTSSLNVHQLGSRIGAAFGGSQHDQLRVTVVSFGFKNGIPIDADLVFDVRFLPNPHWIPALRPLTGLSREVSSYVLEQQGAEEFISQLQAMLAVIGSGYIREGKRFATIAIGCTGGKHRSTAITEEFARRLRADGTVTNVLHRDLGRE
ncbi:RNase adapter RapZ [Microlunatus soli]|uniref:RNase adapter RapZ n=1 Tax=Microlunatus soli TaxID=630515 RepID=UPI002F90BC05